ncbi:MAG: hypothetical protein LBQ06_02500 [Frankiaceae bacterium]|jgi:hypothetical protein|nr:hypothetical protein [Frankiaceae bacterium]
MSGSNLPEPPPQQGKGGGDPWAAFGYLVAGVGLYGLLGWGLSRWLNAPYLIPLGLLVGAGFGLYLVFHEYLSASPADQVPPGSKSTDCISDIAADATRPDNDDDRGETA